MREIKFRAWDKEFEKFSEVPLENSISDINYLTDYEWSQYTGLKDKNGKEIYEGDILTCPSIDNYPNAVVKFGKHNISYNGWYVQQGEIQAELNNSWTQMGEVIGNIYENLELLEK